MCPPQRCEGCKGDQIAVTPVWRITEFKRTSLSSANSAIHPQSASGATHKPAGAAGYNTVGILWSMSYEASGQLRTLADVDRLRMKYADQKLEDKRVAGC